MSDDERPEGEPEPAETDEAAAALAIDDGKGNKMVPLSALMGAKKEIKDLNKRVKDLEPVAAETAQVRDRLDKAQPFIDAIVNNPRMRAEVLRAVNGTRTSGDGTEQPQDDPEAVATAEDLNLYLPDGVTLDVARAQRINTRMDARSRRQADEAVRPLAGVALGSKADANIREALAMVDHDGVPLASAESIKEVAAQLPAHLLSNPQVMDLVINNAIGIDRRKGRTPKPLDEPLYMERNSGRRASAPAISADERAMLARVGLTEKEYAESGKQLEHAVTNRRGIVLE